MQELLKRLRSKTYLLAIASAVIGVVQAYPAIIGNALKLTTEQMGWAMIIVGIAGAVIRELTVKPITEK